MYHGMWMRFKYTQLQFNELWKKGCPAGFLRECQNICHDMPHTAWWTREMPL